MVKLNDKFNEIEYINEHLACSQKKKKKITQREF